VKRVRRPDARVTRKAEMDDLAGATGGHAGRDRLRQAAHALDQETTDDHPPKSDSEQ